MNPKSLEKLYSLLDEITVTKTNENQISHIKELLEEKNFEEALKSIQDLREPPSQTPNAEAKSSANEPKQDSSQSEDT